MKIKTAISITALISIMGCGGGSSGGSSSFDTSGNAPIIEETNSTNEETNSINVAPSNYFEMSGNVNEEIFTVKVTDNSDITYYLTGPDAISFYIDPIIGKVFFRGKKEYENKSSFLITVVVKDALGNVSHKDYTIAMIGGGVHVNDNIPPLISSLDEYDLDDDFRNRFEIEAEDRNPIDFSLEDKSFQFILKQEGNKAIIFLANSPIEKDFVSTVKVLATDIYGNQSSRDIKVNVIKKTMEQPSIIFSSPNEVTIEENSLTKHVVKANIKPFHIGEYPPKYLLFGEDAKYFQFSYELEDITDPFSYVKETYINLKIPADYESKKEYNLVLVAGEEGEGYASQHIKIKISDRDEKKKDSQNPIFISEKQQVVYGEFHSNSKYLASVRASDDNEIKYSLKEGTDANNLVINPSTGMIYVAEHMWGNTKNQFKFTVIATDIQGNEATQDIEVERYNIIVSPYIAPTYHDIITDGHIKVASGGSRIVTTLQTSKSVEKFRFGGEGLDFEDNDDFTLDEETGLLKFRNIPNYFIKSFYKISVNNKIMFITVKKP